MFPNRERQRDTGREREVDGKEMEKDSERYIDRLVDRNNYR